MIFAILTLLTALALAAVAGWFSIAGIMTIYAALPMSALVMGGVMEVAKLVTTSWLYRNWEFSTWSLKTPLIIFTFILMTITSIGVFGYLSKAHIEQNTGTINHSAKIEQLKYEIEREKAIIADNEKIIAQLDSTVNSFLGKDMAERSLAVRRGQANQRKQLREDIQAAQKRIDGLNKEKFTLESDIRKLQLEVGPIRYIAELFYGSDSDSSKTIESAVKIFTLLLVISLDPLAVILLIAANHTLIRIRKKEPIISPEPERKIEENVSEIDKLYKEPAKSKQDNMQSILNIIKDKASTVNIENNIENISTQLKPMNLPEIKVPRATVEGKKASIDAVDPDKHNINSQILRELVGNNHAPSSIPVKSDNTNKEEDLKHDEPEQSSRSNKNLSWINDFRRK